MTKVERKIRRRRRGKKGERERERGAALAVHITLLTIRGQCHRVRPAAPLHFTWLHLAPPLRFSPACPPPPRFASPLTPSHTQRLLSPPRLSRRRCARAIASPLPHGHPPVVMPLLSSSFYPRPRPLLLYRRLLSRVSTSPSFSPPALSSCSCSVFHLVRPHRAFSSTVRVRGHGAPLRIISSRLPRLALAPPSLLRSLLLLLPLLSFFLPALLPPPLPSSSPIRLFPFPTPLDSPIPSRRLTSLLVRAAWYKLFQKFVLLLLSLNHSQPALEPETCTRVQYNARLCSRPADYVNPTTARATTATTGRGCLVPLW